MPRKYPTPDPPRPPPPHPHDRSPADQPARSAPDGTHDGDTHPETTQQQITSNRCPSGVANGSLRQLHFPTSEGILTFTTPSQRAPKPRIWVRERRRDASDGAGSPWLVLVREPDQLGVERTYPQLAFGLRLVEFACLLYTSDAADEEDSVDLGGRRI